MLLKNLWILVLIQLVELLLFIVCASIISLFVFLIDVQSVMPEDALVGAWTKSAHRLWAKRLRRTSSLAELLQV